MPIHELLKQVVAEHEALQSRYNETLVEIALLRTRLANAGMVQGSSTQSAEEDVEAASFQLQFLCEPLHSTLDSGAHAEAEGVSGGTDADTLRKIAGVGECMRSSQTSSINPATSTNTHFIVQKNLQRPTISPKRTDFLKVGRSVYSKSRFLTGNVYQDKLIRFLQHKMVELFFVGVVISNVAVLWVETDRQAAMLPKAVWSDTANVVYLTIYSSEFLLRVLAYRTRAFEDKWNRLDFIVITIDIFYIIMEALFGSTLNVVGFNASIFRLFRIFSLVRVFALFRYIPELQLLLHGFFCAVKAAFFATIMLFIVILLWSFLFVEAVNPQVQDLTLLGKFDDCPRCQRSYESMWDAHVTILQQVVAGDSWGMITLDVIFAYPATSIIFLGCLVSIQFAVLNLVFTVIVDAAMRAREQDELLKLAEKSSRFVEAKKRLTELCESLDTDNSGDLTFDELIDGFNANEGFADMMASMDITRDDMGALFMIMDDDLSGSISPVEFVNNIYQMQERDIHASLMFLQIHIKDIRARMQDGVISLLRSNRTQTLKIAKHVEKMMLHVEEMMQHLDVQKTIQVGQAELNKPKYLQMQKRDEDGKAELSKRPEEDPSAFEAATEHHLEPLQTPRGPHSPR